MRCSILKTGFAAPKAIARRGDFGEMFAGLLAESGQQWDIHDARNGEYPDRLENYDAYLITGSTRAAYDDLPWIAELLERVREIHRRRIPLVGICFGAQVIAQALGGQVQPNPQGWEMGLTEVSTTAAGRRLTRLAMGPAPFRILETHMDIITRLPRDAVRLAGSPRTPVELFSLGDTILGLQGHPEMDNEMIVEIIERMGDRIPPERATEGLDSLHREAHTDFLRQLLRAFLKQEQSLVQELAALHAVPAATAHGESG